MDLKQDEDEEEDDEEETPWEVAAATPTQHIGALTMTEVDAEDMLVGTLFDLATGWEDPLYSEVQMMLKVSG